MRCKTCRYSLANLTANRCPECGREFDPNDPRTYFVPKERIVLSLLVVSGVVFVAVMIMTLIMMLMAIPQGTIEIEMAVILATIATIAVVPLQLIAFLLSRKWKSKSAHRR